MIISLNASAVIAASKKAEAERSLYIVSADRFTQPEPFNDPHWFTIWPKSDPERRYQVTVPGYSPTWPEGKCTCPAWKKEGICKHIYMAVEEDALLTAEEEHDERDRAAEFMRECSREHHSGFTAEVYSDTVGAFPA